jgi:hypothetical protein
VIGALGMGTAYVPCHSTVVKWFARRRGLAVGIASTGALDLLLGRPDLPESRRTVAADSRTHPQARRGAGEFEVRPRLTQLAPGLEGRDAGILNAAKGVQNILLAGAMGNTEAYGTFLWLIHDAHAMLQPTPQEARNGSGPILPRFVRAQPPQSDPVPPVPGRRAARDGDRQRRHPLRSGRLMTTPSGNSPPRATRAGRRPRRGPGAYRTLRSAAEDEPRAAVIDRNRTFEASNCNSEAGTESGPGRSVTNR